MKSVENLYPGEQIVVETSDGPVVVRVQAAIEVQVEVISPPGCRQRKADAEQYSLTA